MAQQYRAVRGTSTRADPDPGSPGFGQWVEWQPGDLVRSWPAHTPVDRLVESGAWEPVKAAAPANKRAAGR